MSSRTQRGRARHFRGMQQGTGGGDPANSPYGRIGQMEAIGEGEQRPTQTNVNAWNSYVGASQRLQELQDAAIGAGKARYTRDNTAIKWDRQADLSRARALRTTIYEYRQNQDSCNAGVAGACSRVGRRNPNDEQYINPSQRSYQDYNLYTHQEGNMDAAETPGDIMGDGTTETPTPAPAGSGSGSGGGSGDGSGDAPAPTPARVDNREQRCAASGGRYDADRGVCFHTAPVVPAPDSPPEEATGQQEPDPDHSHRQVHPQAQGGGSHSGKDGSKTQAGTDGVVHFDTGSLHRNIPQKDGMVELLKTLRALKNPYKQDLRTCKTNKRLVE